MIFSIEISPLIIPSHLILLCPLVFFNFLFFNRTSEIKSQGSNITLSFALKVLIMLTRHCGSFPPLIYRMCSVGGILCGDFNARRPRVVHNPVDSHCPRLSQGCLDWPILHRLRTSEG